jgi:hypothetical protein
VPLTNRADSNDQHAMGIHRRGELHNRSRIGRMVKMQADMSGRLRRGRSSRL